MVTIYLLVTTNLNNASHDFIHSTSSVKLSFMYWCCKQVIAVMLFAIVLIAVMLIVALIIAVTLITTLLIVVMHLVVVVISGHTF